MGHEHNDGSHTRERSGSTRTLGAILALVASYMVIEAVAGWLTNSLALLADAGHMLTDAAAIALALFAAWLARRPSSPRRTYGYHRAEILAALANAAALILIVIFIAWEAWERLESPPPVMGLPMMIVAAVGLAINIFGALILHRGHDKHSLNVQGVFWHVIGDALGSVGAVVAGLLMWWRGWYWADPVVSAAICAIILYGGVKLTIKSVNVLMEASPERLDVADIQRALEALPGVLGVHDLHVWTVTSGRESLSVHVTIEDPAASAETLRCATTILDERFGLDHTTIQVEPAGFEHVECGFANGATPATPSH